jgi:hypothetical protein
VVSAISRMSVMNVVLSLEGCSEYAGLDAVVRWPGLGWLRRHVLSVAAQASLVNGFVCATARLAIQQAPALRETLVALAARDRIAILPLRISVAFAPTHCGSGEAVLPTAQAVVVGGVA